MNSLPTTLNVNGHEFSLVYTYNERAKRLSMRVSSDYQYLNVTLPVTSRYEEVKRFLDRCTAWVAKRAPLWSMKNTQVVAFTHGALLPILGQTLSLHIDMTQAFDTITTQDSLLIVPESLDHPRIIQLYLNKQLLIYVKEKSEYYASIIGANIYRIDVKPLKNSYGMCSSKKALSYAARLAFAPLDVIDYVCAHEVAHLIEMNHSSSFWNIVKHLRPDYEHHRKWLKTHGYTLKNYGAFLKNEGSSLKLQ